MRRALMSAILVATGATIVACDGTPPTEPALPGGPNAQVNAAGVAFPIEVFIDAHQDDWELFAGNQTASSMQTAAKVVIVYVTAGDAGSASSFPPYWQARETASKAAVDAITAAGAWTCASATVNAHAILRCTKANTVNYYMRLPDGNSEGQGYGFGSLALLRAGAIPTLGAVDGTTTYTSWGDLVNTFRAVVTAEAGGQADINVAVHAHDWDLGLNGSDHADHWVTGSLARYASVGRAWNRFWYVGYQSVFSPPNLTPAEHAIKWQTIVAYDNVMAALMGETLIGTSHAEEWAARTIFRSELSDGTAVPPIPLDAPTNLQTSTFKGSRIDLSWTDVSIDEQGYRIARAPDVGGVPGTYVQIASTPANVTSYPDRDILPNTRYWYRVRGYNALSTSPYSNEVSDMLAPPAAPSALLATTVNTSRIALTWTDNADDEQGFRVERAGDAGGTPGAFVEITTRSVDLVGFNDSGLSPGTRYWYRVRAYNVAGTSAYSNVVSAVTQTKK